MAKSSRKHPALGTIEITPQGGHFLRHIAQLVGGAPSYEALEQLDDKSHVFRIWGSASGGHAGTDSWWKERRPRMAKGGRASGGSGSSSRPIPT